MFFGKTKTTSRSDEVELDMLKKFENPETIEFIRTLWESNIRKFRNELDAELSDMFDRRLRAYKSKIARRSWKIAQKWCQWSDDGPVFLPDYARLYYRRGATEVVLMEYPPQVRLMKFDMTAKKGARHYDDSTVESFALALPYLVFVFKFVNGLYHEVLVSFNDRPLKNLRMGPPLKPYLSNIDTSLKLCIGPDFDNRLLQSGNLTQQIALVLNHFWQTTYNWEWSENYSEYREHFANDPRLKNLKAWQDATAENSLFVIENVQWLPHPWDDYGSLVVSLLDGDAMDNKFQAEIFDDVESELLDGIKEDISGVISSTMDRVKDHEAMAMSQELRLHLESH